MSFESAVLDEKVLGILRRIGSALCERGFFIVRGTALAIQNGHRHPIEFDFFRLDPIALGSKFDWHSIKEKVSSEVTKLV